jgi:hypothetical protein
MTSIASRVDEAIGSKAIEKPRGAIAGSFIRRSRLTRRLRRFVPWGRVSYHVEDA